MNYCGRTYVHDKKLFGICALLLSTLIMLETISYNQLLLHGIGH
jgi:hypothetical protein